MDQLLIIGASGHGKVVADIASKNGYKKILFFDDNKYLKMCGDYLVVGDTDCINDYEGDIFVAIGNNLIRRKIIKRIESQGRNIPVLIHPNSVIAKDVSIGSGTVVVAGAIINPGTQIGKGCIINTASSVDHDCIIRSFTHISVGAHVAGTVIVGSRSWIGVGAVISNNLELCSDCMIGAGAVVINDINQKGTYVGVPAKRIK